MQTFFKFWRWRGFEIRANANFVMILLVSFICSCTDQSESQTVSEAEEALVETADPEIKVSDSIDTSKNEVLSKPRVLIVPCSNGYTYVSLGYDLNQTLEKKLKMDSRIELVPFPYVAMKGAGYFGVYDKKHCDDILAKTDVDFLIMTRMSGGIGLNAIRDQNSNAPAPIWGYSTLVLQVEGLNQFKGISGDDLPEYDAIEVNIAKKVSMLVEKILNAF